MFRGPHAARLLSPGNPKPGHDANNDKTGDKEEAPAQDLRALDLLAMHSLGFGSLLPLFAFCVVGFCAHRLISIQAALAG